MAERAGGREPGYRLDEIVGRLGGELTGDAGLRVVRVATLEAAGPEDIAFLANPKYRRQLHATRAGAVILAADAAADCPRPCIVCADPYAYFARVAQLLDPTPRPQPGVHPSAVVAADARLGEAVSIGPGCVIGAGVSIGAASVLHANVTVYSGCVIGARAIIHSGAVIGADGFGFAREADGSWTKIPQIGRVLIGDDVEIGANTTIDRGALEDTVIEDGVKLDNQIQIGHNVRIGAHTAMAGCVGVAGSARIGRRCTVGGAGMILGHLTIVDDVHISAATLVTKSILEPGTYSGTMPFAPHREWLKNAAHLRSLDAMADKMRGLEERLAKLEKKT
jgi:UDP-3-O-[3-hydroxymyristoyl] glucosamine N-acyltransferase